jgi:hypothetical protein
MIFTRVNFGKKIGCAGEKHHDSLAAAPWRIVKAASPRKDRAPAPVLDLLEDAVALLRRTPPQAFLTYLAGAVPFWLGVLYFLSDMSHDAYAPRHISEASLGIALLYVWMKCWQTVFAVRLRSLIAERAPAPWTLNRVLRLVATQAAWQPWGFLVRTLAANIVIPYGWTVFFFQNLTVLGDGTDHERTPAARAWALARIEPLRGHQALGALWIFGIFVWLNVCAVLGVTPLALKMFFGIETDFTRSMDAFLNTTFLTASFALASLILDPLWKAIFVLRCFRGGALRTGEDLAVELKHARAILRAPGVAILLLLLAGGALAPLRAETPPPAKVESSELDQRIGEVLERREYAWRAPREEAAEERDVGWFRSWMHSVGKAIQNSFAALWSTIGKAIQQFFKKLFANSPSPGGGNWDWAGAAKALLVVLITACVALLGWALWRLLRKSPQMLAASVVARPVPDLRSEHVVADQLPEDGWLALAREHAARGELQLALRAAWLASLAHLGQRELLRIARHKSNRDYDRELRRRARAHIALLAAFDENLLVFERAWYGRHEVTPGDFVAFTGNHERIRAC